MKALFVNLAGASPADMEVTFSKLASRSPFGFDIIVIDPISLPDTLGTSHNISTQVRRWKDSLDKWLGGHNKLIVMLRPFQPAPGGHNNYSWLPVEIIKTGQLEDCGTNDFLGYVRSKDARVRKFLGQASGLQVRTHFKPAGNNTAVPVEANSQIDDDLLTSFSWRENDKEVIFIPVATTEKVLELVRGYGYGGATWDTIQTKKLSADIQKIESQMENLESEKQTLSDNLNTAHSKVDALIQDDVYLQRAINSYNLARNTENPDPDNFYEAIESIEKAFGGERKMQQALGLSKNFIDEIMRRTNEFRHVPKSGKEPQPLSADEISKFVEKVEKAISAYIQYLYGEDPDKNDPQKGI